jgi:hypothetical protein
MKLFGAKNSNAFYNSNKNLSQLANELETDKGTADKSTLSWGSLCPMHECWEYTETYEQYMSAYRNKPVKFFEIGICDKRFPYASPKLWLSYFQDIELYCVDNFWGSYLQDRTADIQMLNNWGVNFIYADQGNFCDWNEIKSECPNNFDFVVEDGSHWPNHMAVSLWQAKDLIKSGGYYFMEDLQNPVKSRGMYKYDNSLLAEDLLNTQKTGKFESHFLNDGQNQDVNRSFELVSMVLDKHSLNYLVVFRRK